VIFLLKQDVFLFVYMDKTFILHPKPNANENRDCKQNNIANLHIESIQNIANQTFRMVPFSYRCTNSKEAATKLRYVIVAVNQNYKEITSPANHYRTNRT